MEEPIQDSPDQRVSFSLLLFIDRRPGSTEQARRVRQSLKQLEPRCEVDLEVVDVSEQPYLAEHYRLIASPALIKIAPPPRQVIAGSDIVPQLERCWPRWHREASQKAELSRAESLQPAERPAAENEVSHSAEIMALSDEIFRQKQIRAELEAQLRFKDRIIAMLAHDLRNPLTAASIAVETLEMGHDPDREESRNLSPELTSQLLKHARSQIRTINRMITDILNAAKGASARLQIQPQKLDMRSLCLEVVDSLTSRVAAKAQHIATDLPQDLPPVYADRTQVRRVVVNLLDNAIKYTPDGGKIELTAMHRTTQKVQITVHDSGPGIPTDSQKEIFEESYRLQRDQGQDGYGLGLALCQRIVRAHYGQIWVDSMPGEGSYFYFTLPVYREIYRD